MIDWSCVCVVSAGGKDGTSPETCVCCCAFQLGRDGREEDKRGEENGKPETDGAEENKTRELPAAFHLDGARAVGVPTMVEYPPAYTGHERMV